MAGPVVHAPEHDRVRANTWREVNDRLDGEVQARVGQASESGPYDDLLASLEQEWDFDRVLESEAATMGLLGLALATAVSPRLLVLPATVSLMMIVHATHGWYPLLPLFRRLGVRTRNEIDRERYALKALRGDFGTVPPAGSPAAARAAAAWKAVCA